MVTDVIYSRTVSIFRPQPATTGTGGNIGYSGIQASHASDTIIATNVPASIQSTSMGSRRNSASGLAAAAPGPVVWNIFLPLLSGLPLGSIKDRDFVIDDIGNKYLIGAAEWTPIAWTLRCVKEQA
jgi:hypothetical protein